MSKMYLDFTTSIPKTDGTATPQVDYIAFEMKNGDRVSVSCEGDADYVIENNGNSELNTYCGRYKDLEVVVEPDEDKKIKLEEYRFYKDFSEYNSMTEEVFDYLQTDSLEIYEIGIYFQEECEEQYYTCKNLHVRIEFGEKVLNFQEETVSVMPY